MRYKLLLQLLFVMSVLVVSCNFSRQKPEETSAQDTLTVDKLLEKFTERINANPENDKLYIERANYYLTKDEVELALRDIIFAIDINDQNPDYYITLSEAYLALGDPDQSFEGLEKALALDPANKEALLKKSQLFLIMQQYDKTHETIQKLLAIDKFNPQAYYVNGYALFEEGDTAGAVRQLLIAVDQDQNYFEAYMHLGIISSIKKDQLAVDYLKNAIEIRPDVPEPYYQLGYFYQENGYIDEAIDTYNQILSFSPDYPFALYNLGYIHLVFLKEFEKAVDYFSQVIKLQPENVDALYNRGYAFELMGNSGLARQDYLKVLDIEANYPLAVEGINRLDKAGT